MKLHAGMRDSKSIEINPTGLDGVAKAGHS